MSLAAIVLAFALSGPAEAKTTQQFRPISVSHGKATFDVRKLRKGKVVKARVEFRKATKKKTKAKHKGHKTRKRTYKRTVKFTRRPVTTVAVQHAVQNGTKLVVPVAGVTQTPSQPPKLVVTTQPAGDPSPSRTGSCGTAEVSFGQFGGSIRPGGCWRPYDDSSPFNQQIPSGAPSDPKSAAIVSRTLGFGPVQHILPGRAGTSGDYGRPLYFAQPTDPTYTIHCLQNWGTCPIEGMQVHIPAPAQPAGGSDAHLTVIDQQTGWEYDFWQVRSKGNGVISISWGGRTRIDGNGLGSRAVASNYGTAAGIIRAEELQAGEIDHALFINVNCDNGQAVFPADHVGATCSNTANAPAMGQRFQLQMSDSEIDAMKVPAWKKTILRAMAHYGMFVGDTGGEIGIAVESGVSSTAFGKADPWVELAKSVGAPYYAPDHNYVLDVRSGVDWAGRLRVVAPCVSQKTC